MPAGRATLWAGVPFAIHIAALAAVYALSPWRPAFDDAFHIPDGIRWMQEATLPADGLFLRAPLWPIVLGTHFSAFGVRTGLFLLQAWIVLASIVGFLAYSERAKGARSSGRTRGSIYPWVIPLGLFAISPQLVLYSRHAVNELWIGLLAVGVMLLGQRLNGPRAAAMGAAVAAAGMTKIVGFSLIAPALCTLALLPKSRLRFAGLFALGFVAIAGPLYALHVSQHGTWLLDNTGAYQLSNFTLREWRQIDGAEPRYAAGLASGWDFMRADPGGYLASFLNRSVLWIARPSSADFASFFPNYPHTLVRVADGFVFLSLGLLAAMGTTRRNAPIWLFVLAIWLASSFPLHTPYTPKLILLFPWLLLAPGGITRLLDWARTRKAGSRSGPQPSATAEPAPAGDDR